MINKSTRIGREPSRYSGQTSSLLHTSSSSTFIAARKPACQSTAVFIFCRDIVVPPTFSIAPPVLKLYYFLKKSKLKIMLILSVFLALAMILCIFIFKNPKDKQEYNIDKKEAKILEIENKKIYDISSSISKKGVTTKIKNISANPVRDITIDYVELDKDNKKLSNKQIPVDITLKKNEKALVSIIPAEYTETIDITGYRYKKEDYDIKVDLDNDEVAAIKEDKKENISSQ